jgi:hypothetical protein
MKLTFRLAPGIVRLAIWLVENPSTTRIALVALPTLAVIVAGFVVNMPSYASPIGGGGV